MVGQGYIIGPDVKLPFVETDESAEHSPSMDAHPHVNIMTCLTPDTPVKRDISQCLLLYTVRNVITTSIAKLLGAKSTTPVIVTPSNSHSYSLDGCFFAQVAWQVRKIYK